MNAEHADTVRLYATRRAGAPEDFWRVSGSDPKGCDLICEDDASRIRFKALIAMPGEAHQELVPLANAAAELSAPPRWQIPNCLALKALQDRW